MATLKLETYSPDVWAMYGVIADIVDKESHEAVDDGAKLALERQASDFRHIERYGPRLHATLADLAEGPSYARAVIMERLGLCFLMGARPELAAAFLDNALGLAERLAPGDDVKALAGLIQSELGNALHLAGRSNEARKAYEAALTIGEELGDRRAQKANLDQLGILTLADGLPEDALARHQAALRRFQQANESEPSELAAAKANFEITLYDEVATDCVFDTDLLVEVGRASRVSRWCETPEPLPDDSRPMLRPCTRAYVDEDGSGAVLPCRRSEPTLERHHRLRGHAQDECARWRVAGNTSSCLAAGPRHGWGAHGQGDPIGACSR